MIRCKHTRILLTFYSLSTHRRRLVLHLRSSVSTQSFHFLSELFDTFMNWFVRIHHKIEWNAYGVVFLYLKPNQLR